VVRCSSHTGGVAAADLAKLGILDGLSSDYVPSSLLLAVLMLEGEHGIPLHEALAMATWKVADIAGLADRGHLKPGMRADVLWFGEIGTTPVVRGVRRPAGAMMARYALCTRRTRIALWRFGSRTIGYDAATGKRFRRWRRTAGRSAR
jgi:alpha-D-ribose 1-methylphosphonate 5-triphosphate diphosphatase PhnM